MDEPARVQLKCLSVDAIDHISRAIARWVQILLSVEAAGGEHLVLQTEESRGRSRSGLVRIQTGWRAGDVMRNACAERIGLLSRADFGLGDERALELRFKLGLASHVLLDQHGR